MINEYMFLSDKYKKEVNELEFDGVTFEFNDIKDTNLWTVRCSAEGASERSAKKLSDVHSNIIRFSPKVLTCESAQYFNNTLYPLVNQFERKLRKLVYLADAISNSEKNNIGELEKKDFGEIFDMLFVDECFINELKSRVNATRGSRYEGKNRYAKTEILEFLNKTDESTLWDKIFNANDVPTLKKRFRDIQNYRNNVMHAHNIDKKLYGQIKYLFQKVNSEIDVAIGRRMNDSKKECITPEINVAISSALQKFVDIGADICSNLVNYEVKTYIANSLLIDYINTVNNIKQNSELIALENILNSLEFAENIEQMKKINSIIQQNGTKIMEELSHNLDTVTTNAIEFEAMGKQLIGNEKKEDTSVEEKFSTENDDTNDKK